MINPINILRPIFIFGFVLTFSFAQAQSDFDTSGDEREELSSSQIANAFTPNGDGINDIYHPNPGAIASFEMYIYNRWGRLVYSTENSRGWDGRTPDGQAPEGVYVYQLELIDRNGQRVERAGTLALLR